MRDKKHGEAYSEAEKREILAAYEAQLKSTGKTNWSALARQLKKDRGTIRGVVGAGVAVTSPPVILPPTAPAPDIYAAFLEFAKQHNLPLGTNISQVVTGPSAPAVATPPPPAIYTPTKLSKVAFISDVHIPYQCKVSVRLMLDFLADYKPDLVILGGDIYDFYMVSDYERDPGRQNTLQDEFDEGRYFVKAINEISPAVVFLEGNHESRTSRLIGKNPGLFKLRSLEIPRAAELPSHWQYFPSQTHYKIGHLLALHGDVKGASERATNPAMTLFKRIKRSVVFGHHHRFGRHYDTDYDGKVRGGFANGHLSDLNQVKYLRSPDWQMGFSTICLSADGELFAVQQHLIVNGRMITDGKEWTL